MSFSIVLKKNDSGVYDVTTTSPETLPDELRVDGHIDGSVETGNQIVDLSVRAQGLFAASSRR